MDIEKLSTSELLALYNKTTGQNVKRFADRKTALRRTREALDKVGTKPKAKAKAKVGGGKRRVGFNFTKGTVKPVREGTGRAKLVEMLREGATFEQCVKRAGFKDERNTYQAIRLLNTYSGYGLKQGDDGVIYLVE